VLPEWPEGTVTILVTAGDTPHAIPVSAAVRVDARRVLVGLASGRGSLARLRERSGVALLIVCESTAVTAHGQARVVEEELIGGVVAVLIEVAQVQDHGRPTFEILGGASWRWTDRDAEMRDAEVRSALRKLSESLRGQD
jgi:hypothetical protein